MLHIVVYRLRELLRERFGNEYVIANAWIYKITDRPDIEPYNREGLRLYADEVRASSEWI